MSEVTVQEEFGRRLVAVMECEGYTVPMLARQMDISEKTVQRWRTGSKSPHLKEMARLARHLGIDLGELTEGLQDCYIDGDDE